VLVGPLQLFGEVSVATGASAADGMCRPLGLQAFVFVQGPLRGHAVAARDGVAHRRRDQRHPPGVARPHLRHLLALLARGPALLSVTHVDGHVRITRSPGGSVLAVESVTTQANTPQ